MSFQCCWSPHLSLWSYQNFPLPLFLPVPTVYFLSTWRTHGHFLAPDLTVVVEEYVYETCWFTSLLFLQSLYLWIYPPQHLCTDRATCSATKPLQCHVAEKKNREAWPSTVPTLLPCQFSNFAILHGFVAPLPSSGKFLRPANHISVGRKINSTEVSYSFDLFSTTLYFSPLQRRS